MGKSKNLRRVLLIPEYADAMTPGCDAGMTLLARMILKRQRAIQDDIQRACSKYDVDEPDDGFWDRFVFEDHFEAAVPDELRRSVAVFHMRDYEFWSDWLMEVGHE